MKLKRKIAGIMAALTVFTFGTTTAFADVYYESPEAWEYRESSEQISESMIYVATGTDSKTPWVEVWNDKNGSSLNDLATTALNFESKKNPNKAVGIKKWHTDFSSVKLSKENMSLLSARNGFIKLYGTDEAMIVMKFNATEAKALDISVSDKANDKAAAKLKDCGYNKEVRHINIGGTGKLPGYISELEYWRFNSVEGNSFEDCFMYHYNPTADKFEYVGTADIWSGGMVTLEVKMTDTGAYVVTQDKLPASAITAESENNESNNNVNNANQEITEAVKESISASNKGDTVKIDNIAEGIKVEQSIFTAAKDKGVILSVESPKKNASFKFSAFDKVSEMSGAFDPTVTIGDAIVKDIDKVMAAGKNSKVAYVTVSFAYDGKLPGKTEVTLNVSNEGFKEGQTLYLYYFNETTKAFELVDDSKYQSGSVVFEMEHCSDYIVTAEKLAGADKNSTPNKTPANSPKTGDVSVLLYSVIFLAGLAIITVCARKNREKQL